MEKANNTPKKVSVKYNNVVVFSHTDKSVSVEFAIMLHRSSNEPHCIDVCSDDEAYLGLFIRK